MTLALQQSHLAWSTGWGLSWVALKNTFWQRFSFWSAAGCWDSCGMGAREMSEEEAEGIVWKAGDSSSGLQEASVKWNSSSCVLAGMCGGWWWIQMLCLGMEQRRTCLGYVTLFFPSWGKLYFTWVWALSKPPLLFLPCFVPNWMRSWTEADPSSDACSPMLLFWTQICLPSLDSLMKQWYRA